MNDWIKNKTRFLYAGLTGLLLGLPPLAGAAPNTPARVDFHREILPIFRASCFGCHGPENAMGGLRLDVKDPAMKGGVSAKLLQMGKSKESILLHRITGSDRKPRMPLNMAPIPPEKIELIRRWIDEGARWPETPQKGKAQADHWAYKKPLRPALPKVKNKTWVRNPIDSFVLARLEKEGLQPSHPASKETLIRRVSLDLTGLPPNVEEVDAFLEDTSRDAYEKVVDRLLSSPHYGERWTQPWLDLARYADTNGYEKDDRRSIWKWRDWVIGAFNTDMPFDRFTMEQIAGDLLPNATPDQKVATGFHRNTMCNEEGGVDQEEQRWLTLVDRVGTTGTVWLGSTLACAQCHDHKYDPVSQKEYYQFLAFFDNANEPVLRLPTPAQEARRKALEKEIAGLDTRARPSAETLEKAQLAWEKEVSLKPMETLSLRSAVRTTLETPADKRTDAQKTELSKFYGSRYHPTETALLRFYRGRRTALDKQLRELNSSIPTTLVMEEKPTKEVPSTFIRNKGSFLNKGEKVTAGVPEVLSPLPSNAPRNRLGLARWMVNEENPLTARVTVNRVWEGYFGQGLVKTSEDFGIEGEKPTHPELLDWLATEFVRNGWSMKKLHRLIVTSATYKQSSRVNSEILERDPENKLLARGPRFRVEAETVRDIALSASGLLSRKIGGPSVFPYQPDGIWVIPYNGDQWKMSEGEDRYRRGLYTFLRRTSPYPMFLNFDASSRESCTVKRLRTNTPLQALNLLNDPGFFEAARALAKRIKESGPEPKNQISYGFRLCTSRRPTAKELDRLVALYQKTLKRYEVEEDSVRKIIQISEKENPEAQLAALTLVSNVLLNLDETVTKE